MQQYKKTWQKTKSKITAGQLMFFCMSLPAVPAGASQSSKAIKKVRNGHFLKLSCRVSDKTLPESPLWIKVLKLLYYLCNIWYQIFKLFKLKEVMIFLFHSLISNINYLVCLRSDKTVSRLARRRFSEKRTKGVWL